MATRGTISIIDKEGNGKKIYSHWDNYPSGTGKTLLEHYNTEAKVKKLIALGSISSLRPRVAPAKGEVHTFDNPLEDVVIAYKRDRGETDVDPVSFKKKLPENQTEEYDYVFKDGQWFVSDHGGKYQKLTKEMCERD